jgi:hypothetical protein
MSEHSEILARLQALAAAPKPWLATIYLADGSTREHRQPSRDMAIAECERLSTKRGFVRATVEYAPA